MGASHLKALWLISPRLLDWQANLVASLRKRCPNDPDLVWLLSSGTQSVDEVKAIGLRRSALEVSARAVNDHLQATRRDRWLLALPSYHIGGYAILVRARLNGARVIRLRKWQVQRFVDSLIKNRITLCSLVPSQVHDLVESAAQSPPSLRAVVIGGGALDEGLYVRARALGWPLLPSYGLTECASQVATAPLSSLRDTKKYKFPSLQILPHVRIQIRDKRVWLRSLALCDFVATLNRDQVFTLESPQRQGGWLQTQDVGEIRQRQFRVQGRADDILKILGVLVSLPQIERHIRNCMQGLAGLFVVIAVPVMRRGFKLILVTDTLASLREIEKRQKKYNDGVPGPWRVEGLCWVPHVPTTDLGKIKRLELTRRISF